MADEDKRSEEEQRHSDPEFEEDGPPSDPTFETDKPATVSEEEGEVPSLRDSGSEEVTLSSIHDADTVRANVAEIVAAAKADSEEKSHGHGHGGGGHDDAHIGHTAPMPLLIGVLGALILLTILTVAVTAVDLGSQGNFIVAMVIATVKAILVMGYFMHLFWDSRFNVVAFCSSFLFALLFFGMALLDRQETQPDIDAWEVDQQQMQQ